ncbi:hypothetical protein [Rubrivivax gelatinosus]|uniref:Uncharacterized protein n=1 Tax=Rubrivivax gelatinosus TaxID=28068 RepID=A0A4R2M1L5_RUBGE|nr:hypothetical protein [Rubrivivax gelatinosus]TCP00939.1 hypothetical protein EV684_111144 [Rubrivivax gelatinosus]
MKPRKSFTSQFKTRVPAKPGARARREFRVYPCLRLMHNVRRLQRYAALLTVQPQALRWQRRHGQTKAGATWRSRIAGAGAGAGA